MLETGSYTGGSPTEPSFDDGWWGYVSKDLRDVFGPKPKAPWSRKYCGGGSKTKCKAVLEKSLKEALKVKPATLYGGGDGACAANPQPSCFDANRPQETAGIELGELPVPEPPDLPAGRDVDPEAGAVRGGTSSVAVGGVVVAPPEGPLRSRAGLKGFGPGSRSLSGEWGHDALADSGGKLRDCANSERLAVPFSFLRTPASSVPPRLAMLPRRREGVPFRSRPRPFAVPYSPSTNARVKPS